MRTLITSLCLLGVGLASPLSAQTGTPIPPRADSAALDSLRVELVRSRGFLRAAETQLSKTLDLLDSLRARVPARPDTVVIRDTVWVEVPVPVEPAPQEPDDPAQPVGRVVAITLDPADHWAMQVGDTVTLRAVGGTSELPDGTRREATHEELEAAGVTWGYSGGYAIPLSPMPGDLTIRVYGSRAGRTRIDARLPDVGSVAGQRWVTVLARDPDDPLPTEPDPDPDPTQEPDEPPVLEPGEPVEGEGVSQVPGLEVDEELLTCVRLIQGAAAEVVGDTIRIAVGDTVQLSMAGDTLQVAQSGRVVAWCIPPDWPAVTYGDPFWARIYPAEPPYVRKP